MSAHTPGPWFLSREGGHIRYLVRPDAAANICKLHHTGMDPKESDANARLIAAAPELLEACRVCATALTKAQWEQGQEMAADAIAKVEGRK